jgi:ABC-type Mn2+/Zn2+ transport system ATPase subunit
MSMTNKKDVDGLTIEAVSVHLLNGRAIEAPPLEFGPNSLTVLIGPNGGGKSTLASFICGLHHQKPNGLLDFPVLVWQSPELFPGKVKTNVEISKWGKKGSWITGEHVNDAMRFFDIFSLANKEVEALSGGEAQRVCLARAFLAATSGIVLDEPTTSLDAQGIDTLIECMSHYLGRSRSVANFSWLDGMTTRRKIILCITHDRRFIDKLLPLGPRFMALDPHSMVRSFNVPEVIRLDSGPKGQGYLKTELTSAPPSLFWAESFSLPNLFCVDTLNPIVSPIQFRPTTTAASAFIVADPKDLELALPDAAPKEAVEAVRGLLKEMDLTSASARYFVGFENYRGERVLTMIEKPIAEKIKTKVGDQLAVWLREPLTPKANSRFSSDVYLDSSVTPKADGKEG